MVKERKWILSEPADPEKVERLSTELGIDKVLADLLVKRGVETFEQARSFFRPSLDDLHDPFLMKDMDKAVARVRKAITSEEKILVYGDYDVDGTTAVSLVYSFLRRYSSQVDFYIPDRYDEGYGVSYKGIDWASDNGFGLIITLDCGIKANEKVEYAAGKGLMLSSATIIFRRNAALCRGGAGSKRADDHYPLTICPAAESASNCASLFPAIQHTVRDADPSAGSAGREFRPIWFPWWEEPGAGALRVETVERKSP